MTSRSASFALSIGLVFSVGLVGCQRVHVGDHDAGPGPSDAGGAPEQCGPVLCGAGQVCCNSSCGICTDPGGTCIEIACTDTCTSSADCGPTEYCAQSGCDVPDGTCIPRPEGCFTLFAPVCGCDGETYSNSCEAGRAGQTVASDGECGPRPGCEAMDARGQGECAAIVGIVWDGTRCTMIGGCSCAGSDCASTYDTILECEQDRSGCHSCTPQSAAGEGPCDAEIGVFWNGMACVTHSGCSCVGPDCGNGWFSVEECDAAHRHCFGPRGCMISSDCGSGEWCAKPRGECGGVGTCEPPAPPGWSCPDPGPPVCGCDGVTYGCDDMAASLGASVAHDGECEGACAAAEVGADGACDLFLGWYWDGSACRSLSGCSCTGFDCDDLTFNEMECIAAHSGCERAPGGDCGGIAGFVCRPDEWCDFESSPMGPGCGAADELGRCQPRPMACSFELDPVCGCDGVTHDNLCFANMAGTDAATGVTCASPGP